MRAIRVIIDREERHVYDGNHGMNTGQGDGQCYGPRPTQGEDHQSLIGVVRVIGVIRVIRVCSGYWVY